MSTFLILLQEVHNIQTKLFLKRKGEFQSAITNKNILLLKVAGASNLLYMYTCKRAIEILKIIIYTWQDLGYGKANPLVINGSNEAVNHIVYRKDLFFHILNYATYGNYSTKRKET